MVKDHCLMVEETPFKEVMDLSIQYNTFNRKKETINGINYREYINNYCDKYYPNCLEEEENE